MHAHASNYTAVLTGGRAKRDGKSSAACSPTKTQTAQPSEQRHDRRTRRSKIPPAGGGSFQKTRH